MCAQSSAESPPPTITMSLSACSSGLGTKNTKPRSSQPAPAGSGRGRNDPIPPVIHTALVVTVVPWVVVMVIGPSSGAFSSAACSPNTYCGEN